MKEITNTNRELDPYLQKMFKAYEVTPERNPKSARQARETFMAQLNHVFGGQVVHKPTVGWFAPAVLISNLVQLRDGFVSFVGRRVTSYAFVAMIVFGVFLFGGMGITVYAASSSLPGDAIYPLKTTIENARVSLTSDTAARARLYLDYAGRRLSEIQALVDAGRYTDISQAADEFEKDLQRALDAVKNLSQTDPARAVALNAEIANSLRNYREILIQMLADIPVDVQPVIRNVINITYSEVGDGADDKAGGDDDDSLTPTSTMTATPDILTPTPTQDAPPTRRLNPGGGGGGNNNDNNDDDDDDDDDGGGDD